MWQDYIITLGQVILTVSMIPTPRTGVGMPVVTPLLTMTILSMLAVTFATMELPLTVASLIAGAGVWAWVLRNSLVGSNRPEGEARRVQGEGAKGTQG